MHGPAHKRSRPWAFRRWYAYPGQLPCREPATRGAHAAKKCCFWEPTSLPPQNNYSFRTGTQHCLSITRLHHLHMQAGTPHGARLPTQGSSPVPNHLPTYHPSHNAFTECQGAHPCNVALTCAAQATSSLTNLLCVCTVPRCQSIATTLSYTCPLCCYT